MRRNELENYEKSNEVIQYDEFKTIKYKKVKSVVALIF